MIHLEQARSRKLNAVKQMNAPTATIYHESFEAKNLRGQCITQIFTKKLSWLPTINKNNQHVSCSEIHARCCTERCIWDFHVYMQRHLTMENCCNIPVNQTILMTGISLAWPDCYFGAEYLLLAVTTCSSYNCPLFNSN